jgi:hypothetical protein
MASATLGTPRAASIPRTAAGSTAAITAAATTTAAARASVGRARSCRPAAVGTRTSRGGGSRTRRSTARSLTGSRSSTSRCRCAAPARAPHAGRATKHWARGRRRRRSGRAARRARRAALTRARCTRGPARRAWTNSASHTIAPSNCCTRLALTGPASDAPWGEGRQKRRPQSAPRARPKPSGGGGSGCD